jgi:hypothetical protein
MVRGYSALAVKSQSDADLITKQVVQRIRKGMDQELGYTLFTITASKLTEFGETRSNWTLIKLPSVNNAIGDQSKLILSQGPILARSSTVLYEMLLSNPTNVFI